MKAGNTGKTGTRRKNATKSPARSDARSKPKWDTSVGGIKSRVMNRQETGERLGQQIAGHLIRSTSLVAEQLAQALIDDDLSVVAALKELNAELWQMRWELGIHPEGEGGTAKQGRHLAKLNEYDPPGGKQPGVA